MKAQGWFKCPNCKTRLWLIIDGNNVTLEEIKPIRIKKQKG